MSIKKIITKSAAETQQYARELAQHILSKKPLAGAVVLCLKGDLGAGKTTFTQGFAEGLGITEKILSPTFVVMKRFEISGDSGFKNFYHLDCYRLNDTHDLEVLGIKESLINGENIIVIEWPEKAGALLPTERIEINFDHDEGEQRMITIKDIRS